MFFSPETSPYNLSNFTELFWKTQGKMQVEKRIAYRRKKTGSDNVPQPFAVHGKATSSFKKFIDEEPVKQHKNNKRNEHRYNHDPEQLYLGYGSAIERSPKF